MPSYQHIGSRIIEVGAGPGMPALYASLKGANSIITDLAKVLPLIQENIDANGLDSQVDGRGSAIARVLEWGAEGYEAVVASLASPYPDLVIACDTCYVDPVRV